MEKDLLTILQAVHAGKLSPQQAQIQIEGYEDLGFAKIDHDRTRRQGAAEVIYGASKSTEQILSIVQHMKAQGVRNILCTRMRDEALDAAEQEGAQVYRSARLAVFAPHAQERIGNILVVSAGTSDQLVAEEAALTAETLGAKVTRLYDAGVAGIHRLLSHQGELNRANVIIAVAGLEGALPSVVAGLTDRPVIAVPTSIGYGASFGGIAALLAMLNSCGSGVVVVNIDNGFGAGYAAAMINRRCREEEELT